MNFNYIKYVVVLFLATGLFSCNPNTEAKLQQTEPQTEVIIQNNENINDKVENPFEKSNSKDFNFSDFDFLPTSTTGDIINRETYSFSYNEQHEQSEWVAYVLTKEDTKYKNYGRPYFNQDPMVKSKSADWKNYKNVPYNRGHLLPAADRRKTYKEYEETFYTSNVSPQNPEFNAGVWNRLEQKVRYWAAKYDGLYVITGGILEPGLETIGYENVSVPKYFYKVLLTKDGNKMIAFLMPHQDSEKPLYEFVTSVDEIEKRTGIDFFVNLPDELENNLEKSDSYKGWSFN